MTRQLSQLMKQMQGDEVTAWISICSQSGMAELEAVAPGIQKELPAFLAACSPAYNNGMAERFVNKLTARFIGLVFSCPCVIDTHEAFSSPKSQEIPLVVKQQHC